MSFTQRSGLKSHSRVHARAVLSAAAAKGEEGTAAEFNGFGVHELV